MKNVYPNLWTSLLKIKDCYESKPVVTYGNKELLYSDLCVKVKIMSVYLNKQTSKRIISINLNNPFDAIIALLASLVCNKGFWLVNNNILGLVSNNVLEEVFLLNNEIFEKGLKEVGDFKFESYVDKDHVFCWTTSSGSSLVPKITEHSYFSLMEDTDRQLNNHKISSNDRIDVLSSLSFSASLSSIFPVLLTGASLHIKNNPNNIEEIYSFWLNQKITMTTMIPSLYRSLLSMPFDFKKTNIRFVCLSGEKVTMSDFILFKERFSEKAFFQAALASSETRAVAEFIGSKDDLFFLNEEIPYSLVKDKDIWILDKNNRKVGAGKEGHVAIVSKVIGSRYVNFANNFKQVENGDRIFISDDIGFLTSQGILKILDSNLRRVKFKGEFIDLDVLEKGILKINEVLNCVVVKNNLKSDLNIYIQSNSNFEYIKLRLSKVLKNLKYNLFLNSKEFPKLHSGKIDHLKLQVEWGEIVKNEYENEVLGIYKIWRKIFPTEVDFRGKHFFYDLGGDSMSAVEFAIEYCNVLKRDFDPKIIHMFPIYDDLLEFSKTQQPVQLKFLGSEVRESCKKILIFSSIFGNYSQYDALIKNLEKDFDVYVILYSVQENNKILSVEEIVQNCSSYLKRIDVCFYSVIGYSFSGLLAYQTASMFKSVKMVFLIDTPTYQRYNFVFRNYKRFVKNIMLLTRYAKNHKERYCLNKKLLNKINTYRVIGTKVKPEVYDGQELRLDFFRSVVRKSQHINNSVFYMGVFIASNQNNFKDRIKAIYNWEKYNSNILFKIVIKGGHKEVINDDNLKIISNKIKQCSLKI
jgi:acyl-coenzyme A synthetase/AMP-(fatty) acid ligase